MRERIKLILLLCIVPLSLSAQRLDCIIETLSNAKDFNAEAEYEVFLPSSQEPVPYSILLHCSSTPEDSLSPCSYIIRWRSDNAVRTATGFSAYFDGHHYRFRNHRLQEFHILRDHEPFAPKGDLSKGVHRQAQFADLIPQFIALRLREIARDSNYTYNILESSGTTVLTGSCHRGGYTSTDFSYTFDSTSGLPLSISITYNPAAISEQTVNVRYSHKSSAVAMPFKEETLIRLYPDAFARFRTDTFRAENLIDSPLPTFSARIFSSDERLNHTSGNPLSALTLLVFLDPAVDSVSATVSDIRQAVSLSGRTVNVIWVFPTTNHSDDVISAIGSLPDDETALISARSPANACGISLYPTLVLVNAKGIVKDVIIGANQDLSTVVIQKISLN